MPEPRVVLLGRSGCHLCQDAEKVLDEVTGELGESYQKWSLDEHPELLDQYAELIPVVLVDGRQVAQWRVDSAQLRGILRPRRGLFGRRGNKHRQS